VSRIYRSAARLAVTSISSGPVSADVTVVSEVK